MRILSVKQLKPIQVDEDSFVFPLGSTTKIILDKTGPSINKTHQLLYQQGSHFGSVGDCCKYLDNSQLLHLENKGMIEIKKAGVK